MYYNEDIMKEEGGDKENKKKKWDEVIEIGGKIKEIGNGNEGIDLRWKGEEWML